MKGAYCLVLEVLNDSNINVGSLGTLSFPKGFYVYIGSALNNIEKRVMRHLRSDKKLHWHIDYLTTSPSVKIKKVYYKESLLKEECSIAKIVKGTPITAFGCSDCKCESHLFKIDGYQQVFIYSMAAFYTDE